MNVKQKCFERQREKTSAFSNTKNLYFYNEGIQKKSESFVRTFSATIILVLSNLAFKIKTKRARMPMMRCQTICDIQTLNY